MASLMGTKVVVVGGSSGIGLGVAKAALQRGAQLVIVGRSQDKLLQAQRTLATDGRVETVTADMTRERKSRRHLLASAVSIISSPPQVRRRPVIRSPIPTQTKFAALSTTN